jgi:histidinol-phosphate aminotransferase
MTATHSVGRPRPAVDLMPAYRPGKAASQAEAEHGITNAIKLASNENPLPPIQSIVDAVAARPEAPTATPTIGPRPFVSGCRVGSASPSSR